MVDGGIQTLEVRNVLEAYDLSPSPELVGLLNCAERVGRLEWLFGILPDEPWPSLRFIQGIKCALINCYVFYLYRGDEFIAAIWLEPMGSPGMRKVHFFAMPGEERAFLRISEAFFDMLKTKCGIKYLFGSPCEKFYHIVRLLSALGFEVVYRTEKTFVFRGREYGALVSFKKL